MGLGGYLQELERFFSFGIQRCHLIWYALLVELAAFCAQAGVGDPARVRAAILRDSVRWRSVPPALRQHLDAVAAAPYPPAALLAGRRPDAAA